MAKPKDPKRLRRHGVSERERQQIRVYCYENPGKPQKDAARYLSGATEQADGNDTYDTL
jgi:hypothetical protein